MKALIIGAGGFVGGYLISELYSRGWGVTATKLPHEQIVIHCGVKPSFRTAEVELWKQTDSCYQKAVIAADAEKMLGLENCFISMAREVVFECMVYI